MGGKGKNPRKIDKIAQEKKLSRVGCSACREQWKEADQLFSNEPWPSGYFKERGALDSTTCPREHKSKPRYCGSVSTRKQISRSPWFYWQILAHISRTGTNATQSFPENRKKISILLTD